MSTRLRIYTVILFLSFAALLVRLFYWQVYRGEYLSAEAKSQYKHTKTINANRGDILASDGTWLVSSGTSWLLYASIPNLNGDPKKIANDLVPVYFDSRDRKEVLVEIDRVTRLLQKKGLVWVAIKSRLDDEQKKKIEKLNLMGIGFEMEEARVYPEGSSSAHLLGFVGKDDSGENKGYFGLEGHYNISLSGKPGYLSRDADTRGVPIILGSSREVSAIKGVNLQTSIDKTIQLTLERKLKKGVEDYGAKGGTAIIMNPRDGSILGMSSYPSYDPSYYWEYGDGFFNNPAIFASFEPGSVFKILIMAAGIDAGVITPESICDVCTGAYKIDKYFIKTWNNEYHPESTMTDVIVNSDNVGMTFVGEKLGLEKMLDYLQKFKIGELSGIDLQGEISPKIRSKESWGRIDVATASFGQGIAVTPIQMIRAAGAIANGGIIRKPMVVKKIIGDGWEEDVKMDPGERVISEKTAREVTLMMAQAASKGESKWTYRRGFKVAGKTGTAQIPIAGNYDEEKTNASFIGFAPYNDPKFIMLVMLQEPKSSPWASETAAPLWYSIAGDLFTYFGIQPTNEYN